MGFFKIRRALAVSGGSIQIGADTNLYRSAADLLKTDDALEIAGTVGLVGAVSHFKAGLGTVTLDAGTVTVRKHTALGGTTTVDGGTVSSVTVGGTAQLYGGTAKVGADSFGTVTLTPGTATIVDAGGTAKVAGGTSTLGRAAFGTVTLTPGTATIVDAGGTAKVAGGTMTLGVITLGTVTVSPGTVLCRDAGGTTKLAGSIFVGPYGAAAPTLVDNGELSAYHSGSVSKFVMRAGGTVYTIAFPNATHGTITVTVGSPPA